MTATLTVGSRGIVTDLLLLPELERVDAQPAGLIDVVLVHLCRGEGRKKPWPSLDDLGIGLYATKRGERPRSLAVR